MAELSSFGEWLRRQRKGGGWTQEQLALQISCSTSALKKFETEERRPSAQIVERLAEIFKIPQDERRAFFRFARGDWEAAPTEVMQEAPWRYPSQEDQSQISRPTQRSALPTGTVTFLYTDIEGSTQLWQQHPKVMASAHARHDQILRGAIESNHGYIFQVVGDAFCAAFHTVIDAVHAAIRSQMELQAENWGEAPIRVRMGIHTGKAEVQEDGLYSGFVILSHVQRLMSVAHGGQVLLSFAARELVQDESPEDVKLRDMGKRQLKDWSRPERIFQLVIPGLPADFPPLNTPESFLHNLPVQLTSFIGRERELSEIKELFSNTRLLTLTGPGGTGKTRLALQAGEELFPSFAEGVWFAELAPLTDDSLIPQPIASIFGLHELPNLPILNIITDYLRAKQLLLILDNCEHLVEACAKLTDHLLRSCPQLKVIATSREALYIAGESIYQVPSLSLPDKAHVTRETGMRCESVQLFVERASAVNPKFKLTDDNASDVAQICQRLDGIPLALELAAARSSVFSPKEIASRLDDRFRLLTGGNRTALERHQTLRALIDWSYDLLSREEQTLLRQLSVFAGGWTFEAVEAICSDLDVLNLLTQLVDKSLVALVEQDGSTRYNLLETIRQYAHDKLLEAGESEQVRTRHAEYFLKFAEAAEPHLDGPQELEWLALLETEHDNLRAALEWGLENNVETTLRMASAVCWLWIRRGNGVDGRYWLTEALSRSSLLPHVGSDLATHARSIRAKAFFALGRVCLDAGDLNAASAAFEESVVLSRQIGDKRMLVQALVYHVGMRSVFLGNLDLEGAYSRAEEVLALAYEVGDKISLATAFSMMGLAMTLTQRDLNMARSYREESIRLLRESGSRWATTMTLFSFAAAAAALGDYADTRSLFETCLSLFIEMKDKHRINMMRSELAHLERKVGQFEQAKPLYRETLQEWQRLGHRAAVAHELECLAIIAKAQEDEQRAAKLFGAAEILRETIDVSMTASERVEYDREVSDLRANMDKVTFARAWAEGRALTMEQAIEFALES